MKKIIQKIIFSCSVLAAIPILLISFLYAVSFLSFYVHPSHRNQGVCTQYYVGMAKGTVWEDGEWHHYVDFKVNNFASFKHWEVTDAPLPSSLWWEYSTTSIKRVAYRWPSNWRDPFPANDWKICVVRS